MSRKVLVCDDERHIVRLLEVFLERKGFQVVTAFDGHQAMEKIRTEHLDLCVLDLMLPGLTGLELLNQIRSDPSTENLPVIVISGKAQDQDAFDAYHHGADLFLTKPFNPQELVMFSGPH